MINYNQKKFIFLDHCDSKILNNHRFSSLGVIYRNYNNSNREKELIKISKICKRKNYKLYVSNDIRLALKYKADGIYIPSFNKNKMFLNLEKRNFNIIGSAHNQKEIHQKIIQKCTDIFLSPLFYVDKSKQYLNVHKFNCLSSFNKVNIYALGGINDNNIKKLKLLNIKGFGGISIFKKKPACKRPVF